MLRFNKSLVGGFWGFIFPVVLAVDSFLICEFESWAEVVLIPTPLFGIDVVDQFDQFRVIESVVSE